MDEVFTREADKPKLKPQKEKRRGIQMHRINYNMMSKHCYYCERRVFPKGSVEAKADPTCSSTKDHYVPRLLKVECEGIERQTNGVVACAECNTIKGWFPGEVFEFYVRNRGEEKLTTPNFQRFIYKLALAGFKAAKKECLK